MNSAIQKQGLYVWNVWISFFLFIWPLCDTEISTEDTVKGIDLGFKMFRIQTEPKEYNMLDKINLNASQIVCLFAFP